MPLFVLIAHDTEGSADKRQQTRPAHIARLKELENQGRLYLAGPCPQSHTDTSTMLGSLMIVDFDNHEQVEQWVKDEPYLQAGVYSHVDIRPFIKALPNSDTNA